MDGLFNIYKEAGMTSHDVVSKMRKIMQTKTVGHTGTLDPNATGVLPIAVGRATKVIEYMENDDKVYVAELTLGIKTDTEDIWGNVLEKKELNKYDLSFDRIKYIINSFIGKQIQIPPMYSALKVNGKKLYELARDGKEVVRQGREIEIFNISNISINENKVTFTVHCSKGTYIRTLCKDIGDKLGCGATMSKLERVRAGKFLKDTAVSLDELKEEPIKYLINLESVIEKFPVLELNTSESVKYMNGVKLKKEELEDGMYRVYIEGNLYGICVINNGIVKNGKRII